MTENNKISSRFMLAFCFAESIMIWRIFDLDNARLLHMR